jgi:hypothetical protein
MDPRVKDMTGKRCGLLMVTAHAGSIRRPGNSTAILGMPLRLPQGVDCHRLGATGRTYAILRLRSRGGE